MRYNIPIFKVTTAPVDKILNKLEEVLTSGYLAEGAEVQEFENKFKKLFNTENVFATNSCANGLMLSLKRLGVGPNTSVIVTPMTCVATACPVSWLGAEVIWADVNPETGLIDPNSIEERIQDNTKAILAVYWGGDVPDMDAINDIAKRHGLGVVEDAAQALGAKYPNGKLVGDSESDFVVFSFQAIKHLTTGDGGMVICNNSEKAHLGKLSTWFGIDKHNFRLPTGEINWDLDIPEIGYKMHMNNVTAAIGNVQFDYVINETLPKFIVNGLRYETLLKDIDGISLIPRRGQSAYWVYTFCCERRDELMKYLIENGVQASRLHAQISMYTGFVVPTEYDLSGVKEFSSRNLSLPCGPWVSKDDMDFIAQKIKDFYNG